MSEVNNEGQVTVSQVNEAVKEAGGMPKLTQKQQEKLEAKREKAWNTMISRKEALEMIQKALQDTDQRMQMLFIQNATLLQILQDKGIATLEEINELSKVVMEDIFGPMPTQDTTEEQAPTQAE